MQFLNLLDNNRENRYSDHPTHSECIKRKVPNKRVCSDEEKKICLITTFKEKELKNSKKLIKYFECDDSGDTISKHLLVNKQKVEIGKRSLESFKKLRAIEKMFNQNCCMVTNGKQYIFTEIFQRRHH